MTLIIKIAFTAAIAAIVLFGSYISKKQEIK